MGATFQVGTGTVHTVPITAQSHARLRHLLPKVLTADEFDQLRSAVGDDGDASDEQRITETMVSFAGKAYDLLVVLAPALELTVPAHAWQGYGSPEAQAADSYDPAVDNAPTIAQIVDAFDAALEVNGLKKLGELMKLIGSAQAQLGGPGNPPANGRP